MLKENGLCCAIVPENIFNMTCNKKEKEQILKTA